MNKFSFALTAILMTSATFANAQNVPQVNPERPNSATTRAVNAPRTTAVVSLTQLRKGSNSFTMKQAKMRIERAGFSSVTDLKKDKQGIWQAKAMRDGKSVAVGFDYKGNIGAE